MQSFYVSVIIPMYKVASFVERCADSLFRQTLESVEFIFVDDASPDNSMERVKERLERYPNRKGETKLLLHSENKGLPAARNTGLEAATGEYIFHCDSDDFVEPDTLETMYKAAKAQKADIVWCDWFLSFEKNERYMTQPYYATAGEALKGILNGQMKYNVWNKLVRRQLYADNNIWFPAGYGMGEDMTMIRLFACARKVAYVPQAFYHYVRVNDGSFTNTASDRHLKDMLHNTEETIAFLQQRQGRHTLDLDISAFKLSVKYPFLISDQFGMYRLWQKWFPEANDSIMKITGFTMRQRVLQLAAVYGQFWLLWLHYRLVHKIVYGVIYK